MSIVINFQEFSRTLEKEKKDVVSTLEKVVRRLILEIFENTVYNTPVDTGILRASWGISLNIEDNSYNPESSSISTALQQMTKVNGNIVDNYYIFNNKDYAEKIEYGGSKKAPAGMLRIGTTQALENLASYMGEFK